MNYPPTHRPIYFIIFMTCLQAMISFPLLAQNSIHTKRVTYIDERPADLLFGFKYFPSGDEAYNYAIDLGSATFQFQGVKEGEIVFFINEIQPQNKGLKKNARNREFFNNYQIVIERGCLVTTGKSLSPQFTLLNIKKSDWENAPARQKKISFIAKENGTGELTINFGLIKNETPRDQWSCETGSIKLRYEIKGLVPPPKEPVKITKSASTIAWEKARPNGMKAWATHLEDFKESDHKDEALSLIKKEFNSQWRIAETGNTIDDYKNYIGFCSKYPTYEYLYRTNVKTANRRIARMEADNRPCYVDWGKIKKSTDPKDFQRYFAKYSGERDCRNYTDKALENRIRYSEMEIEQIGKDNSGFRKIIIKNAKNPRYKDRSLFEGLKVNAQPNKEDQTLVLNVEYSPGVRYELFIEDEYGKKDSITFDNSLSARVTEDSLEISFSMEKGKEPYRINFLDPVNNNLVVWADTINKDQITYQKNFFQQLGLSGYYQTEVWDQAESWNSVKTGKIQIPEQPAEPFFKRFFKPIIGGGVLIVILIGFFFFYNRKNRS